MKIKHWNTKYKQWKKLRKNLPILVSNAYKIMTKNITFIGVASFINMNMTK